MLSNKIDFVFTIKVENANPNGDPNNENRPRDYNNVGEISDVCLKRKIRDRMLERFIELQNQDVKLADGQCVLYQADNRKIDDAKSIKERLGKDFSSETILNKYLDVRAFGALLAFTGSKKDKDDKSVSIGIRGPVTISTGFSLDPIDIKTMTICSSANKQPSSKEGATDESRSSDRMGSKHVVEKAIYIVYGSMNAQASNTTMFSDNDAEVIKLILPKLFENDSSAARPDGSMKVVELIWVNHKCKNGKFSSCTFKEYMKNNVNKNTGEFDIESFKSKICNDSIEIEKIKGF